MMFTCPQMGRIENLNTDPGSKFRGASFLKNLSKFQNDVYMPKIGRTENLNTDPGNKFRSASFLFFAKMSLFCNTSCFQKTFFVFSKSIFQNTIFKSPEVSAKNTKTNL